MLLNWPYVLVCEDKHTLNFKAKQSFFCLLMAVKSSSSEINHLADELTARGGLKGFGGPEPDQDDIWSMAHPAE